MKEKAPLPPDAVLSSGEPSAADGRGSAGGSAAPPIVGIALVLVGILFMSLSGWTPTPSAAPAAIPAWENVSNVSFAAPYAEGSAGRPAIVSGTVGDDDIYGEDGGDAIAGGEGDDFIEAKDGARDYISCGSGEDVASVDELDAVCADCETVYGG